MNALRRDRYLPLVSDCPVDSGVTAGLLGCETDRRLRLEEGYASAGPIHVLRRGASTRLSNS
jgi:hypothetical protein